MFWLDMRVILTKSGLVFELFCLQNSLIVGMQPQVSGKVGSLVGWFLGGPCSAFPMTVEFYRKASCRDRNKNAGANARKIPQLKRHDQSVRISLLDVGYLYIK